MNKDKVLLLISNNPKTDIFYNDYLSRGYHTDVIIKDTNKLLKPFRRLCLKNNNFLNKLWLTDVFNKLDNYEVIIINMNRFTKYLPEIIHNKYPDLKVIAWYWNTVDNSNFDKKIDNPNIEYYSFDKSDCEKYGFKYNTQYYCDTNIVSKDKDSDVYFIGLPKGREEIINDFKNKAEQKGIKCNFKIIESYDDYLSYEIVKQETSRSKAVLEINKSDQNGLTLRSLESLFLEVKLITNNPNIKNYPFYNKNNIFILDEDNYDGLYDFINSPYDDSVNIYKKDYELDTWFNNFFI